MDRWDKGDIQIAIGEVDKLSPAASSTPRMLGILSSEQHSSTF
jgi:hypothetical protein